MNLKIGNYLLDTNVLIDLKDDPAFAQRINPQSRLFIPSAALGELYYGAENSARPEENLAQIERLLEEFRVLPVDFLTARWYGQIKAKLRRMGQLIPDNDLWIAALALQYQFTLITDDLHFEHLHSLFPGFNFTSL